MSAVQYDAEQLGRTACRMLLDRLLGKEIVQRQIEGYQVILRESTKWNVAVPTTDDSLHPAMACRHRLCSRGGMLPCKCLTEYNLMYRAPSPRFYAKTGGFFGGCTLCCAKVARKVGIARVFPSEFPVFQPQYREITH